MMQINEQAIAKLDEIIETLREKDTEVLEYPVDYIHIPLPDYLSIVDRPFCLNELEDNLQYGKYQYLYEFIHDFCLILNNARAYNYGDEPFLLSLDIIEKRFCDILKKNGIDVINVPTMRAIGQYDGYNHQKNQILSLQQIRMIKQKISMLDINETRETLIIFLRDHNMEQMLKGNEINLKLNLFTEKDLNDLENVIDKLFNKKFKSVV